MLHLAFYADCVPRNCTQYYDKGFSFYSLSHDCHFDIDHDVSTAHCRSSTGDSVDLLSQTICTTMVVSD